MGKCKACGGKTQWSYSGIKYLVFCTSCFVQTKIYQKLEQAIEAWNRRVENANT